MCADRRENILDDIVDATERSEFTSHSPARTRELGQRLAEVLLERGGGLVCLFGDLGSGKTTLVKGLGKGLGIEDPIVSPSYLLLREYKGKLPLHHIDLFRIESEEEFIEAGLEDQIVDPDGVVAIEWAGRVERILPVGRFDLKFETEGEETRKITLECK